MPEAKSYEKVMFAVKETKVRDKSGAFVGTVTLESANSKGCSRLILVGEETLVNEYRVGEFYNVSLEQCTAPEED